jgi:hypothetical protein
MAKIVPAKQETPLIPHDKGKVGEPDRDRVSANQYYEVSQLAQKHGLPTASARPDRPRW